MVVISVDVMCVYMNEFWPGLRSAARPPTALSCTRRWYEPRAEGAPRRGEVPRRGRAELLSIISSFVAILFSVISSESNVSRAMELDYLRCLVTPEADHTLDQKPEQPKQSAAQAEGTEALLWPFLLFHFSKRLNM